MKNPDDYKSNFSYVRDQGEINYNRMRINLALLLIYQLLVEIKIDRLLNMYSHILKPHTFNLRNCLCTNGIPFCSISHTFMKTSLT